MFQSTPGAGGGQAQQRELRYKVTVVADTSQANQAFDQMKRQAQGAAYQQPAAYQQGAGYAVGQPPPPPGMSGGQSGGGGADKNVGAAAGYAVLMTRLTVAVGFVTQAMEKFRGVLDAVNTQGRETVNAQAKMEKWFENVPVVGGQVGKFMSFGAGLQERWGHNDGYGYGARAAAKGTTFETQTRMGNIDAVRNLKRFNSSPLGWATLGSGHLAESVVPALGEFAGAEKEFIAAQDKAFMSPFEIARDEALREAKRRKGDLRDGEVNMSEAAGFRVVEARDQSRLLFAGKGERTRFDKNDDYDAVLRQAERARVTASVGGEMAGEQLLRAQRGSQEAKGEITGKAAYDAAQKRVEELKELAKYSPTHQAMPQEAIADAERLGAEYAQQLAKYQEALNAEKEKSVNLAQKEFELAQKSLAVEQSKLSVVEAKLKVNDQGVESFAMLNGGQRQGLLDSVKQLNDGDFGSLSPRQRELLAGSGITSDYFRKKARDYTNADPEARGQLDELMKATGQQTRTELLEQQKTLQAKIELQFVSNPEQLADQLRKAFKLIDPELRKLVEESLRLERGKIERQETAGRAQK